MEREIARQLPGPMMAVLSRSGPNSSTVATYALSFGRSALGAAAAFVLASVLGAVPADRGRQTYRWVRGFLPADLRPRFVAPRQKHATCIGLHRREFS